MRRFLLGWRQPGHEQRLRAQIVNYADDFVICCRGTADEAMAVMRSMMARLKLTVNETKTRICQVPHDSFDFLGYTIGRCYSQRTGRAYIDTRPSPKKVERICREIGELRDHIHRAIAALNRGPHSVIHVGFNDAHAAGHAAP